MRLRLRLRVRVRVRISQGGAAAHGTAQVARERALLRLG